MSSGGDPRRPTRIYRYKPSSNSNKPGDDPSADYLNLLGMIFSMCGLMMRVSLLVQKLCPFSVFQRCSQRHASNNFDCSKSCITSENQL